MYRKEELQSVFKAQYNKESWSLILKDLFKASTILVEPQEIASTSSETGYYLGEQSKEIGFFYYDIHNGSVLNKRVGLRQLADSLLKYYFSAAIVVFNDGVNWRVSFICDLRNKKTHPKRFTYVFGDESETYNTAVGRFLTLQKAGISLQTLHNAFSVEKLSDEFFDKYRELYADFVCFITGKRYVKKEGKWEEEIVHDPHEMHTRAFGGNDKRVRDYIKKMLGRLIFLQFLQKKGWMNVPTGEDWGRGDKHFLQSLFINSEYKDDFLDRVLEPLFFDTLNRKRENDIACVPGVHGKIPYLNGGLFENDHEDDERVIFPQEYFKRIFDFFGRYNFTIDENDPNDAEVGVDPEMLGKIFENLLEDNKDKGAFYTPKEVVMFMCKESLKKYIHKETQIDEPKINALLEEHVNELNGVEQTTVLEALKGVKICDPAIGSGAFPMGLLNELLYAREMLEADTFDRAEVKKSIVQDNIYGVDIEHGAIDIARLRFWLSIVVDEKYPDPLPNLDFKFIQGDSLTDSFEGVDLSKLMGYEAEKRKRKKGKKKQSIVQVLAFDESDVLTTIRANIHDFYLITNHEEKVRRRHAIDELIKEYLSKVCGENHEVKEKLQNLDMKAKPYFIWDLYFNDVFSRKGKEGFDIVIGNPPYIKLDTFSYQDEKKKSRNIFENLNYETFTKTGDIYCLFYERGLQLLRDGGIETFITSNSWMRAKYGAKTREFLGNYNPTMLFDLGSNVFDNATVATNILIVEKDANASKTTTVKAPDKPTKELSDYFQQNMTISCFQGANKWVALSPMEMSIKQKIENNGKSIVDWNLSIYRGVLTGCNEAFVISGSKRNEILDACSSLDERKKTAEIIRPILRGRDVKRYSYDFADQWLIMVECGLTNKHAGNRAPIQWFSETYPTIYKHLNDVELAYQAKPKKKSKGVVNRDDQGDYWWELRPCNYWEDFSKQKIIWKRIGSILRFSYDTRKCIGLDSTCILVGEHVKFLTMFFNSIVGRYQLQQSPKTGTGDLIVSVQAFEPLYIIEPTSEMEIISNQFLKNSETEEPFDLDLCKEFDNVMFRAYGFSDKEITFLKETK